MISWGHLRNEKDPRYCGYIWVKNNVSFLWEKSHWAMLSFVTFRDCYSHGPQSPATAEACDCSWCHPHSAVFQVCKMHELQGHQAYSWMSEEDLGDQAKIYETVTVPTRSPWNAYVWSCEWNQRYNRDLRKLRMLETWTLCLRKPQAVCRVSPRKRPHGLPQAKNILSSSYLTTSCNRC